MTYDLMIYFNIHYSKLWNDLFTTQNRTNI